MSLSARLLAVKAGEVGGGEGQVGGLGRVDDRLGAAGTRGEAGVAVACCAMIDTDVPANGAAPVIDS